MVRSVVAYIKDRLEVNDYLRTQAQNDLLAQIFAIPDIDVASADVVIGSTHS